MHRVGAGIASLILLVALGGCGGETTGGSKPTITSFTANPSTVAAAGESVTLSWVITGAVTGLSIDNGVGTVSGSSRTVTPTATTTYTLTAGNSSGSVTATTTVTVGAGTGGAGAPTGTFGASASQSGPFTSDADGGISSAADSRVVKAEPNSTIYFQAAFSDPDGITAMVPYLANKNVDTVLTPGTNVYGFTSAAPTGCEFGSTQTSVTCTFAVAVGDIPNITEVSDFPNEFAYVFKVRATDGAGNSNEESARGYVTVGSGGTDPTDPTDPANQDPVAAFTSTQNGSTVVFSAATSSDPDGDTLTYAWDFGDNSSSTSRDFTKTYAADGSYTVKLTVNDGEGGTDTETKSVTIGGGTPDNQAPVASFTYSPTAVTVNDTVVVFNPASSSDADGTVTGYAWSVKGPSGGTSNYTSNPLRLKFSQVGTYTVTLVVSDNDGATSAAVTQNVEVTSGGSSDPELAVTVTGPGSVTSSPAGIDCPDTCSEIYTDGATVVLTATPDEGATFTGWGGDCTGTGACTVMMDGDQDVTATFTGGTGNDPTLTLVKLGGSAGSVTSSPAGINCDYECVGGDPGSETTFDPDTLVTLTATVEAGTPISWLSGCDTTTTDTCNLTMDESKTVQVRFGPAE